MSMTREQMLSYMETPALLNEKTLGELREILDEFPYFQTAHLLYARNLLNENNFRFANQVKICAIHATDRTVLYNLLNSEQKNQTGFESPESDISNVTVKFPLETSGEVIQREKDNAQLLNFESGESAYRLEGDDVESEKTLSQLVKEINEGAGTAKNSNPEDHNGDLIDRFIKENPSISNRGLIGTKNISNDADQEDTANENDEFITETLAKIYIKQGLYQKAINAFQRLTLKYPEKSVYFARQIEEVTNLLNK